MYGQNHEYDNSCHFDVGTWATNFGILCGFSQRSYCQGQNWRGNVLSIKVNHRKSQPQEN